MIINSDALGMTKNNSNTGLSVSQRSSRRYFIAKKNHNTGTNRMPIFSSRSQKSYASADGEMVIIA